MEMDKDFYNSLVMTPKTQSSKSSCPTPSKQTLNAKDWLIVTQSSIPVTSSYPWQESIQSMYDSQVSSNAEDPHQKIRLLNQSLQRQSHTANNTKSQAVQNSLLGLAKTYSGMYQMDLKTLKVNQPALKTGVGTPSPLIISKMDIMEYLSTSPTIQPSSTSTQEPNDLLNGTGLK